ncbi:MAG TPA: acyl-CoA thioesterase/bile acid-CoA:amino acid N-acyltransferase family protein [Candidatus Eremiobacteraceae bacterium]|nr:acyl-CoA thioesterase/bile acid-CoA:amino acid N-acyltransferase family protein [Candidatus Eremiobacteraceae bacterium]
MDERLSIVVSGLPTNQLITLRAKSRAQDQLWWRSEAVFNSGPKGTIDLNTEAPASGTYKNADGMGLFWSMKPDAEPKSADHAFFAITDWFQFIVTEIEADDAGHVLGSAVIRRRFAKPGIHCGTIAGTAVHGFLCDPGDHHRHPGVMVLGGSEGGQGLPDVAILLASRGFTTLSLAYFGADGLPPTLQNIPIEYLGKALEWLHARPETEPGFTGVFGASRGAEVALQFAATYPDVNAVVARSPTNVRWEGITKRRLPGGSAWTYRGQPLPYIPNRIPFWFVAQYMWDSIVGDPVKQTPLFIHDLEVFGDTSSVEIPAEHIHGPVLLLSGNDDQIWPSSLMATRLMERLRRYGHLYPDDHLFYDNAGHWIPVEYLPTAGDRRKIRLTIGGTPEGSALAQADSWPKVLRFLAASAHQE